MNRLINLACRVTGPWGRSFLGTLVIAQTAGAIQLPFADNFADRGVIAGASGELSNDNTLATRERGEPRHDDTPSKTSVWVSWVAPQDGMLTLQAASSGFQTVLGVYANELALRADTLVPNLASTSFDQLAEAAADVADDGPGDDFSRVNLPVRAGVRYEIAVSGVGRSTGNFRLNWGVTSSTRSLPKVIGRSKDRTDDQGERVVLSYDVISGSQLAYQWLRDGVAIPGANAAAFVLPSLSDDDVGTYSLRVSNPALDPNEEGASFVTRKTEIQSHSGDRRGMRATDTLAEALALVEADRDTAAAGDTAGRNGGSTAVLPELPAMTVIHSYPGSQTFSTVAAQYDPAEPLHCGVAGGASYWYAYTPVANGSMIVNTVGSTFDTILAVYTYNASIGGYAGLTAVACQNDQWSGNTSSSVSFPVTGGVLYLVVVDGVNGAHGTAKLNYNYTPAAPAILVQPAPTALVQGQTASFSVVASAPVANTFQWRFGGVPISGATGTNLVVTNVTSTNNGRYDVVVRNSGGMTISTPAALNVVEVPTLVRQPVGLQVAQGQAFTVSASAAGGGTLQYQWRLNGVAISGANAATWTVSSAQSSHAGNYSVVVSNAAGTVTSASATVSVLAAGTPPSIAAQPSGSLIAPGSNWTLSCSASGATSYQWYRNGTEVSGATGATLALSNVQTSQAGEYSVRAANASGQVISQAAAVTVLAAPQARLALFADGTGISCATQAGRTYLLQSRSSLASGSWQTVQSILGTGGNLTFADAPDPSKRFFRIVVQQ